MSVDTLINQYIKNGRIPWSKGYGPHKYALVSSTLDDANLMAAFRTGGRLPDGFGDRIDERIVEYPWIFSRLDVNANPVLDAGSVFNKEFLLKRPELRDRNLIISTLATDWVIYSPKVSYLFGDFRDMLLRDSCIPSIVCLSTLEHVGLGQDYDVYNQQNLSSDQDLFGYRGALLEFHRVLKSGGQLLLTVPYGRRENHGWLQQFDAESLADVVSSFPGKLVSSTYYLYKTGGWQVATADECADASYHNVHTQPKFDSDYAAAARCVACLEFRKA